MIDIDKYEIFRENRQTLRELSKDDSDPSNLLYMTESEITAVDFDTVKTKYVNQLGLSEETAASVDAMVCGAETITFIEFKNGNMKNEKRRVKDKLRDSLLIFCDITKKNISYTRQNVDFILVYNIEKNPPPNQLTKDTVQPAPSRDAIAKYFLQKAKQEFILFGLEQYKKLYFREIHTYSQKEFENYLEEQSQSKEQNKN